MTMTTLTENGHSVSSGFRVDLSRGERIGRVSSEWFSRPDDQRYLSLTDLNDAVSPQCRALTDPHRGKPLRAGPFEMRRCRRHRRSIGLLDQLSIMTLADGPPLKILIFTRVLAIKPTVSTTAF
jgi:hypothetical protein